MDCAFSPAICHIDKGAITRNFKKFGTGQNLMPVIKSDAYGHGLFSVAEALAQAGAAHFAVGTVEEAVALATKGFTQTIIPLLGCLTQQEREQALAYGIVPLIRDFEDLKAINSVSSGQIAKIALKFNTGMSRLGFNAEDLPQLLEFLHSCPKLQPVFALTHLYTADMPEREEEVRRQAGIFFAQTRTLQDHFPGLRTSLGNSAALAPFLEMRGDVARPGIALYGGNPFAGTSTAYPDLEWAMSVAAPIIQIRDIPAGSAVSYGGIFQAARPMRIGVVAAGYANGIPRSLSGKFSLLVNGRRAKQIGRICMGMLMVDLSENRQVKTGDLAWLLGGEPENGQTAPTVQELADIVDTIPYELLCLLGSLNRRIARD